jgi:hypothetical protein
MNKIFNYSLILIVDSDTPYVSHQKEAIDFIVQRETGQIPQEQSLWRYNDVDADEPLYEPILFGFNTYYTLNLPFPSPVVTNMYSVVRSGRCQMKPREEL